MTALAPTDLDKLEADYTFEMRYGDACTAGDWWPALMKQMPALLAQARRVAGLEVLIAQYEEHWRLGTNGLISIALERKTAAEARAEAAEAQAKALAHALEPFEDMFIEGVEDYLDTDLVVTRCGRSTEYTLQLGHFRRARSSLVAYQEAKPNG